MNEIKIDFKELFDKLSNYEYVVVKLNSKFPKYSQGEDIDIFCRDIEGVSGIVIAFLNKFVTENSLINIKKYSNNFHIDLIYGKKIHFRFDLYKSFPDYMNVRIKPSLFDVVIESGISFTRANFTIKVPSQIDEAVLRYIEYQEYFASRPDKIKHIEHILSTIGDTKNERDDFFARVHYFIELSVSQFDEKSLFFRIKETLYYYLNSFLKGLKILKNDGLLTLFKKIKSKF